MEKCVKKNLDKMVEKDVISQCRNRRNGFRKWLQLETRNGDIRIGLDPRDLF